jgi:hypothetical protein
MTTPTIFPDSLNAYASLGTNATTVLANSPAPASGTTALYTGAVTIPVSTAIGTNIALVPLQAGGRVIASSIEIYLSGTLGASVTLNLGILTASGSGIINMAGTTVAESATYFLSAGTGSAAGKLGATAIGSNPFRLAAGETGFLNLQTAGAITGTAQTIQYSALVDYA